MLPVLSPRTIAKKSQQPANKVGAKAKAKRAVLLLAYPPAHLVGPQPTFRDAAVHRLLKALGAAWVRDPALAADKAELEARPDYPHANDKVWIIPHGEPGRGWPANEAAFFGLFGTAKGANVFDANAHDPPAYYETWEALMASGLANFQPIEPPGV